ncbi:MAG: histidine kinase dimerization/phosphoacceptor domain -containing protein [Ekhidna sp.]
MLQFRYILFLYGIFPFIVFGQYKYPHRYFDPREYQSDREIFSIDQSEDGTMYFGTGTSILQYDGERWKEGIIPGKKAIFWLKVEEEKGRIYVGSEKEFGYFDFELVYFSLSDKLDASTSDFGNIWEVDLSSHGVYFRSSRYIFRYYRDELTLIDGIGPIESPFDIIFTLNDTIYTRLREVGLATIYDGKLEVIVDAERFGYKCNAFVPHPEGILIATRSNGLFLYKNKNLKPLDVEVNQYLKEHRVYHATALSNEYFAFATLSGGVLIMDQNGRLVDLIKQDNYGVYEGTGYVFEDSRSGLWIGTKRGMAYIDINSPVRYYQLDGITEVTSTHFFEGKLHIGSLNGIYVLEEGKSEPEKVRGSPNLVKRIFECDNMLIATDLSYFFQIEGLEAKELFYPPFTSLTPITSNQYDYAGGGQEGIYFLNKDPEWVLTDKDEGTIKNVDDLIEYDSSLWGISSSSGLFRYDQSETRYDITECNALDIYKEALIATADDGFYTYDSSMDQFRPFQELNQFLPDLYLEVEDFYMEGDSTWLLYFNEEKILTGDIFINDSLIWKLPLFDARIEENVEVQLKDGLLIVTNGVDIFHLNTNLFKNFSKSAIKASISADQFLSSSEIPYAQNKLRFDFAVKAVYTNGDNYYRYRIDGYNNDWSSWSTQNYMEITNLFEGDYDLLLEAKTPDRSILSSSLSFSVLPPWYRTYWAYGSYLFFLSLFVWRFVKWRSSYLEDERNKLEDLVADRTSEIIAQKATIEQSLKEREVLLREIHHRVKNNLQVISSIFNMQLKEAKTDELKKLINDGQSRIKTMSLIHQKLYQSDKLDAIDLNDYANGLISQIGQLYGKKECQIKHEVVVENIHLDIDTAIPVGLILNELLSNSYKYAFDEGQGHISIHIEKADSDSYQLAYCDDGKGFPDGFDLEKGESLGLRLVSILARQLKGTMEFKNGNGVSFTIAFKTVDS